ncbi:DUF4192 domain-containing protein [Nocardia wallacei]|uniref:DUF4192 domain-containing protein n=1 Tax=Nocardia wallacei TaxID=480035 RepID=UPI002456A70A|nr:DUF4192 domain-containing protein [Nocardia wallacei]
MSDTALQIGKPGELITAVPALLGFYPADSLVLVTLVHRPEGETLFIGVAARLDLHIACDHLGSVAVDVAAIARQEAAAALLILIVDSTADGPDSGRAQPHRAIIDALRCELAVNGVAVLDAWAVPAIEHGARWWSLLGSGHGVLDDPGTSPIAVAHVLDGRPIRPDRGSLEALVAPDAPLADQVRPLLTDTGTGPPRSEDAVDTGAAEHRRAAVSEMIDRIDATAAGVTLTPEAAAGAALALRDRTVRDCLIGLIATPRADAAQQFWALLARGLPDPDRAQAATLLAVSAYTTGDGPLAIVAVHAALDSDPGHEMALLLDTALRTGMPPDRIREMAATLHNSAAALGVDLHA